MAVKVRSIDTQVGIDRASNRETWSDFWIDPDKRITGISQEGYHNGCPSEIYLGLIITRQLESWPDEDEARDFLSSPEGQELLDRVCDGFNSVWNGHNIIGKLDENAEDALDDLVNELDNLIKSEWSVWLVDEWLVDSLCDASTTDEELEQIADEVEENADSEHVSISGSVLDFLISERDRKRDREALGDN